MAGPARQKTLMFPLHMGGGLQQGDSPMPVKRWFSATGENRMRV